MVRISAIFIAVCMVLIAGALGAVLYLRFGLSGAEAALVALGVLTALAVYNALAARFRDRSEVSSRMADFSRGSGDLARQLAEYGRRLGGMETKVDAVLDKALATAQPLAAEIEELSRLLRQLADTVAAHDIALAQERMGFGARAAGAPSPPPEESAAMPAAPAAPAAPAPAPYENPAFKGLDRDGVIAAIRAAIEGNKVELYLQPIVSLPQRKVRYYEALSRLRAEGGDVVAAGDFLAEAEAGGLLGKLDDLSVLRCVQVVRRLQLKTREIGLFCNLAGGTLTGAGFPQFLEFADANRAIAPALVFEFSQAAVRAMGPIEHESLAALAERGFRFSIDNVVDLRLDPRELGGRGFRFVKVPAALLLNRVGAASTDIHPADLSDLLGRFGIDLIAERIESEGTVVDLLDYDVRFGQGFLFSPPRPVRAEALQAMAEPREAAPPAASAPAPAEAAPTARAGVAPIARTGSGRA
jgi:cyclic-di-GMP phosphodiesterase TipF (flagellum assembly factor)